MSLAASLKAEARRQGFALVGITTPDPPPHLEVYQQWVADGRYASMEYLATERARERRADPRQILPECRSILVLGMRYARPEVDAPAPEALMGQVAAYAWGSDYHDVLPERLKNLVAFLEAQVGEPVANRWYTDTGPILERDMAQRAGLGWAGKNTCLIDPQTGSYYLLAEILLGLELPPDPPFLSDHCGTCTRCIDACPTQVILPDRTLEAGGCISYLTIENKGEIPLELRPKLGDWIFGCDICQQVCPWNERAGVRGIPPLEPDFAARPGVPAPDLIEELALTPEAFNQKFKGSPVKRAKRRGYLRNVAVAMGNSRSPRAIPALQHALQYDPEPLVRSHAAWALGQIGGEARDALEQALRTEQAPEVVAEIQQALERVV